MDGKRGILGFKYVSKEKESIPELSDYFVGNPVLTQVIKSKINNPYKSMLKINMTVPAR